MEYFLLSILLLLALLVAATDFVVLRTPNRPKLGPDYAKIAALETEIYGRTFESAGAPVVKTVDWAKDRQDRLAESREIEEKLLRQQPRWNPVVTIDPDWADEDGRPW